MFHLAHLTLQAKAYHKLSRPITNPLALNTAWRDRVNSQPQFNKQVHPGFKVFSLFFDLQFVIGILKLLKQHKLSTAEITFCVEYKEIYQNKTLIFQVWYHGSKNILCWNKPYNLNQPSWNLNTGTEENQFLLCQFLHFISQLLVNSYILLVRLHTHSFLMLSAYSLVNPDCPQKNPHNV